MNISFEVEGEQVTISNVQKFDTEKKALIKALVKVTAANVWKDARARVPVSPADRKKKKGNPGDLKASITRKTYFEGLGAMVLPANPKGAIRGIVEAGTSPRFTKKGAYRGSVSPQPFMEPAKQAQEPVYNAALAAMFKSDTIV